ncbi:hypothetical protein BCR34DRAFT_200571 [Clohesyomyces aquaticus]|uniref:DUF7730 domain-containing protein n=1 Tax=Clohesyomyces aquaticus TaxID=1231657 RepID=A0A1Y1YAX1_9PLEO|nr:hypothetical protein BCR34DRAFT_200571 [Clohesyomyces aquaticus]
MSATAQAKFFFVAITSPIWCPLYLLFLLSEALLGRLQPAWAWLQKEYDSRFVEPPRELLKPREINERIHVRKRRDEIKALGPVRRRVLTLGSNDSEVGAGIGELCPSPEQNGSMRPKKWWVKNTAKSCINEVIQQSIFDQLGGCKLYKLPYEVRKIIWHYAVGSNFIHIVRKKGRLGSVCCPAEDPTGKDRRDICLLSRDYYGRYVPTAWPNDIRLLSLITSCRQIYSETVDVLYSQNTFSFDESDLFGAFIASILPKRKNLLTSLHFVWSHSASGLGRNLYFEPRNDDGKLSRDCLEVINSLPSVGSLTITPSFACAAMGAMWHTRRLTWIHILRSAQLECPIQVTIPWASGQDHPNKDAYIQELFSDGRFHLRQSTPTDHAEWLSFFIPFNVQCLHCDTYTIIRKATRGVAQVILTRKEPYWQHSPYPASEPKLTRYWTFHSYCRGWMEFQYDWDTKTWSVTQGAKKITDDEAETHLAKEGFRYPSLVQPHERLHPLSVKPNSTRSTWSSFDINHVDLPTKEMYYRNVGWTKA